MREFHVLICIQLHFAAHFNKNIHHEEKIVLMSIYVISNTENIDVTIQAASIVFIIIRLIISRGLADWNKSSLTVYYFDAVSLQH